MTQENRFHIGTLGPGDIALLKDVAESAADRAVKKWFVAMGLDPEDPIGAQRNFNFLRSIAHENDDIEAVADKSWTRKMRLRSDGLPGKVWTALLPIAALGALNALWEGTKAILHLPSLIR